MNTASTPVNGFAALASELFQQVDGNKDGKLSAPEFQSFLESLLTKVGSGQTPGLGSAASAGRSLAADVSEKTVFEPMAGFDYAKLNNPAHTTPKYMFARATQHVSLQGDRASRSAGLGQITAYLNSHGFPNAKVSGDDTIDFGGEVGTIDVLTGDGQWWWGPK